MTSQAEFKESQIEAEGLAIRYLEAGKGDTIVALDSLTWGMPRLYHALAQKYRVVVLEAPTPDGDGLPKSPKNLAAITAQASAALAPDGYSLIGTSLGANAALWQALQDPEKTQALVLISSIAILPSGGPPETSGSLPIQSLLAHLENAPDLPPLAPSGASREHVLLESLKEASHDAEVESSLGDIQCATLAVFGVEDKMVSSEAPRVYRAKIPNCNISLVYDAGHLIEAERPEALINLVLDFVERRETFIVGRESRVINP